MQIKQNKFQTFVYIAPNFSSANKEGFLGKLLHWYIKDKVLSDMN